jgi:hypothetical protein
MVMEKSTRVLSDLIIPFLATLVPGGEQIVVARAQRRHVGVARDAAADIPALDQPEGAQPALG